MPVVSNTSPVLNLAIVGRLSLLREQFGEVWIPAAVLEELRVEENLPGCRAVREALEAGWLRIEEVKDQAHNYLAASGLRLAIILNFGAPSLEFKRVVN